jgi:serine/threonine protein kinase
MLSTREETDEVIVKLGDFGLSTFLEDEQAPSTYAGTKEYLAPVSCPLSV